MSAVIQAESDSRCSQDNESCDSAILKAKVKQLADRMLYNAPGALIFFVDDGENWQYKMVATFDDCDAVPVGRRLSEILVETPPCKRSMAVAEFMRQACMNSPVCLFDLGILFDPGLDVDPMHTLLAASKGRVVFAEWPGAFDPDSQTLRYAEVGDSAYRSYPLCGNYSAIDFSGNIYPRELNQGTQQ